MVSSRPTTEQEATPDSKRCNKSRLLSNMARASLVLVTVLLAGHVAYGSAKSPFLGLLGDIGDIVNKALPGYKYCPPPYHHVLGECFYVHQYVPQLTWEEAQDFCRQAGGIGAEPEFFTAILAQLFNMGKDKEIYNGELSQFWLGGQRVENTTYFEWTSGRPIKEEVKEGARNRRNFYPPQEETGALDCIMIHIDPSGPPVLSAEDCEARAHYVCQLA